MKNIIVSNINWAIWNKKTQEIEVYISTADLIAELEKRRPCERCKAGDCNGCLWQSYSAQEFKRDNFKEAA